MCENVNVYINNILLNVEFLFLKDYALIFFKGTKDTILRRESSINIFIYFSKEHFLLKDD